MQVALIVAAVLVALVGLLLAATVWDRVAAKREKQRFRPPGRLIELNGGQVHVWELGPATAPTVVIETGRGHPAVLWSNIALELAKTVRVVLYDRPGYGWSAPAATPRTARQIAIELHELLGRTSVPGPYVLAGHSMGGMYVRAFAALYPDDVAGMVLVDARHQEIDTLQPPAFSALDRGFYRKALPLARLGFARIVAAWKPGVYLGGKAIRDTFAEQWRPVVDAVPLWPDLLPATAAETACFSEIPAELSAGGDLGDKPLLVLTAGRMESSGWGIPDADWEAFRRVWAEAQTRLAGLSKRGRQIIVSDSGHNIHLERPEVVIQAIETVVNTVRSL